MNIRELRDILDNAPEKDKEVEVEYMKPEIDALDSGYVWQQARITDATIYGGGVMLEVHPTRD